MSNIEQVFAKEPVSLIVNKTDNGNFFANF